jgi:hypothetical protein
VLLCANTKKFLQEKGKIIKFPFKYFLNEELIREPNFENLLLIIIKMLENEQTEHGFDKDMTYKTSIVSSLLNLSEDIFLNIQQSSTILNLLQKMTINIINVSRNNKLNKKKLNLLVDFFRFFYSLNHPQINKNFKSMEIDLQPLILDFFDVLSLKNLSLLNLLNFKSVVISYHEQFK